MLYTPRISPSRRQIDNRFPSLGFTIDTGGRPYFEVLLSTDPTLFAPGNASKRSASNFYTSSTHHGLLTAVDAAHPYLVPSSVLRGFVAASRPSAIYYTLIAYRGSDGSDPAFANPPSSLPTSAPSISIAADFSGNTLATVLGVDVQKLRPVGPSPARPASPVVPSVASSFESETDDVAEGEDGYGQNATTASPEPAAALAHTESYGLTVLPSSASTPRSKPSDPLLPRQNGSQRRYSDGYGAYPAPARGLGTDYAADQTDAPDYLADDDEDTRDYTSQSLSARPATRAYGDEAEELAFGGPGQYQSLDQEEGARSLTIDDKIRIIEHVAAFESGGDYSAINPDGEFEGRFGPQHPAYQHYHVGLSYGFIQFTQDSGMLGQLLTMMRDRDPDAFGQIFGPDADELVRVCTAAGPPSNASPDGRSARVQPVAGADLWHEPWVSRFRAAGQNDRFRAAQRELAARGYLDPMLALARGFGLDTEQALSLVVDRSIQMGVVGAKRWIASVAGPLGVEATRRMALGAVGYSDLRSFQTAAGITADGDWGPDSHAALVGALRALGASSPVPIPTTAQMIETLVHGAANQPWHARVEALRSAQMPDVRYQL
jgi:hypothetical protein